MQNDQKNSALDQQNAPPGQMPFGPAANQNQPAGGSVPFSPQVDLPPMPPEFQNVQKEEVSENKVQVVETPGDSGSGAPPMSGISNVIPSPKRKFGTGKIIATILSILLVVGGVGAGTYLVGQKQLFQQKAESCGATCRTNCTEDETGQGQGSCPGGQISCVANSCNGVPDAGTTCVSAGFVCVPKGSCGAGHNQAGSCNTANTDCCDTASVALPTGAQPASSCIFDNYQHRGCVEVNGTWMMCDKDPKGEVGYSSPNCKNDTNGGQDLECGEDFPNCVPGGYCISATVCTPSVAQYANCVSDSSCFPTNPPGSSSSPTPVAVAPYCAAITTYDSEWVLISASSRGSITAGSVVNFCVSGATPGGTFDKARFTINGILQAETTTVRPNSTDFCKTYTIPSGTATFNVSAQIHHATLGWF